jgi:6-phosphogluconate dehydrogenase
MANQMSLGVLGLGRMGMQIARRLHKNKFKVVAWNRSPEPREEFKKFALRQDSESGSGVVATPQELIKELPQPRILWFMLPAGDLLDEMLFGETGLAAELSKGDIIIDGGNSFYQDSQRRAQKLEGAGVHFFDAGTSGGVWGGKNGFSLMVGGPAPLWSTVEPIFKALAAGNGKNYGLVGKSGAGHFVKMVHNGIEYGMMEAIGEGLAVLKASDFDLNLSQVTEIWSKGSVVSSWLVELAKNALDTEDLNKVLGYIHHTGEGEWTIKEAKKLGVDVRVIEDAFKIRQESADPKNQEKFSNKIVALLRKQFGGHDVKYKE